MDNLPRVDTCCGCCNVESGSKIIAWLAIVSSTLAMVILSIGISQNPDHGQKPLLVTSLTLTILELLLYLILLFGLHKKKPSLIKFYLFVEAVLILLAGISLGFIIYSMNFGDLLTTGINICFHCYFYLVINSYYHNLVEYSPPGPE